MLKITLSNWWFHAHHGLHEEEKILGGDFVVDVSISYQPKAAPHHLSETIDYTAVYRLIKQKMAQPQELLETLAMDIADEILQTFPQAEEVRVSVQKTNPPIAGFTGNASVSYTKRRELCKE